MDVTRVCRWCSKPVPKGRRAYCSEECQEAYYENRVWSYARAEARKRQPGCTVCGKKTTREVHHIKPLPDRSYYSKHSDLHDQSNLLVLCELHHEEAEKARRRLLLREEAYRQVMEAMRTGATPPLPVQLPLLAEVG